MFSAASNSICLLQQASAWHRMFGDVRILRWGAVIRVALPWSDCAFNSGG